MTIKVIIKNDDSRDNAIISVEKLHENGSTEDIGELKGGESKEVGFIPV